MNPNNPFYKNRYAIALLLLLVLAVAFYLHDFKGINTDYDDFAYAYFVEYPLPIPRTIPAAGAFGYLIDTPLYLVFGNSLSFVTASGILPILLIMLVLFEMGKRLGGPATGLAAAILFAFNPMTYTYAPHLLPEPYISLVLALSMLLLLHSDSATGMRKVAFQASSGFVAALTLFFGVQAYLMLLSYCAMLLFTSLARRSARQLAYGLAGAALGFALFMLLQFVSFGDPFYILTYFSHSFQNSGTSHNLFYYLYLILPPIFSSGFNDAGPAPRTNLGALFMIFIATSLVFLVRRKALSPKARKIKAEYILPYSGAGIIFLLYVMFGTSSVFSYTPILDMNRLIMPAMVFFALAIPLSVSLIKGERARRVALALVLLATAVATIYYVGVCSPYYSAFQWIYGTVVSIPIHLNGIDASRYALWWNYSQTSAAVCFELRIEPNNCGVLSSPAGRNFSQGYSIFILNAQLANRTYYYHNSTYGYYIYVNNATR